MDLSVTTETLQLTPQRAWVNGAIRKSPSGDRLDGTYVGSYWYARLFDGEMCDSRTLALDEALYKGWRTLAPHQSFFDTLRRDGGTVGLVVGLFASENFGMELSQQLLSDLASLGADLGFDVYP
jgi:hypothetical protein